jgi:hypothetical protein
LKNNIIFRNLESNFIPNNNEKNYAFAIRGTYGCYVGQGVAQYAYAQTAHRRQISC